MNFATDTTMPSTASALGVFPETPLPDAPAERPQAHPLKTALRNLPDLWDEPLTDLGNARRLVHAYGTEVRYMSAGKVWLIWDGRRWIKDDTGQIHRYARQVIDAMMRSTVTHVPSVLDSVDADAEEQAEAARQRVTRTRRDFARRSQSRARLEAMVALAQCELGMPVRSKDLDVDPWLLCVGNGTLNLRTGTLQPHRRGDLITRLAPVDYDPHALCPLWERTLARLLPDPEVRAFIQRSIGYALTGSVREQCVFFWHGAGRNGKSTVLETLRRVFGDYGLETPVATLLVKNGGSIPSDVARLDGARFVTARETEDGERLAESLIKQLSGGDTMTARYLFHEWFSFTPVLKLFLATNHRPQVRGTDEGLWRRIHLVPWDQTLTEDEVDKDLLEKLKAEAPGILAWAVRGCSEWQRIGLCPPPAVKAATAAYRSEMDSVGRFLEERCVLGFNLSEHGRDLYAAYAAWAREEQTLPVSPQEFARRLTERGFCRTRPRTGSLWEGLALFDERLNSE